MAVTTDAAMLQLTERKLLSDYLAEIAVPIFYDMDGDAPELGTGTLLDVGGHLLLVTAAHVLADKDITKFSTPWGRNSAPTSTWGSVGFLTPKVPDAWDVAIVKIQYPETIELFRKHYRCLTLDQIAMPRQGATHILAGFPAALTTATYDTINQAPLAYYTEMLAEPPPEA